MAKRKEETLDGGAKTPPSKAESSAPRFADHSVSELGGALRLRRMQPEVRVAILKKLSEVGCDSLDKLQVNAGNRRRVSQLVQLSLAPIESARLLCPGEDGLARLMRLSDERITELAKLAADHSNLFDGKAA